MKKVVIVLIVLALIVGVTAFLNREGMKDKALSQENAILIIVADGAEHAVTFDEIQELEEAEYSAVLKSSGKEGVDTTFTGVALKDILAAEGIDVESKSQVITKAVDGYTVALSMEE